LKLKSISTSIRRNTKYIRYNMSSITTYENAVRDGRVTYKQIVEAMLARDAGLVEELFEEVALPIDDPKVLRKAFRAEQASKFSNDPDGLKDAMRTYDMEHATAKEKRPPPPARSGPMTDLEKEQRKATRKAKQAFLEQAREEAGGGAISCSEMEKAMTRAKKEWATKLRKKKSELSVPEPEEPDEEQHELEAPKSNATKSNETKPNETKPKATKPKATKPKATKTDPVNAASDEDWD